MASFCHERVGFAAAIRAGGLAVGGPSHRRRGFNPPALRWNAGHRGVDLAARLGAPVRSAAAGTVRFAGQIAGRGVVVVDHGSVRTTYEPVIPRCVSVLRWLPAGDRSVGGRLALRRLPALGLRRGADYLDPLQLLVAIIAVVRLVGGRATGGGEAGSRQAGAAWPGTGIAASPCWTCSVVPVDGTGSATGCRPHHVRFRHALPSGVADLEAPRRHRLRRRPAAHRSGAARRPVSRVRQRRYGQRLMIDQGSSTGAT